MSYTSNFWYYGNSHSPSTNIPYEFNENDGASDSSIIYPSSSSSWPWGMLANCITACISLELHSAWLNYLELGVEVESVNACTTCIIRFLIHPEFTPDGGWKFIWSLTCLRYWLYSVMAGRVLYSSNAHGWYCVSDRGSGTGLARHWGSFKRTWLIQSLAALSLPVGSVPAAVQFFPASYCWTDQSRVGIEGISCILIFYMIMQVTYCSYFS